MNEVTATARTKQVKKDPQTKNYFGIDVYKRTHPVLKGLKKRVPAAEVHGDKIWGSSLLIMDYLENYPIEKKSKVMELGCGWGALSIYCAKNYNAKVTAVDVDENVFPYLEAHANLNQVNIKCRLKPFEDLKEKTLGKQDLIVGTDICFWDELTDSLFDTIARAVEGGASEIIIADPGRPPFLKLAKKCKKAFGAKRFEWDIQYPKRVSGYILSIQNG